MTLAHPADANEQDAGRAAFYDLPHVLPLVAPCTVAVDEIARGHSA